MSEWFEQVGIVTLLQILVVLANAMVREIIDIYYGQFTADLCEMKFLKKWL